MAPTTEIVAQHLGKTEHDHNPLSTLIAGESPSLHQNLVHRKLEEVEYWRQRTGWYDDDVSMREYNAGIHDGYYRSEDDDMGTTSSSGSGLQVGALGGIATTVTKVVMGLLALIMVILFVRAIRRRMTPSSSSKKSRRSSRERGRDGDASSRPSRHRSASRSRSSRSRSKSGDRVRRSRSSRSRSRARKPDDGKDYALMSDEEGGRSRKSRKERRVRSSRSRSRARREKGSSRPPQSEKEEPMLV